MFEKILYAGWGDMDFNSHMRNTAYLDKSGDVRMIFFSENGFSGKDVIMDSKGLSSEVEGTLYYYLVKFAMDTYFPRLFIRENTPTEAGVMEAREAVVNLTGLSLRVGIRIRL